MKGYIGDRFDKVAASLTADDCGRIITDSTGDTAAAARCKELIDACEAARYAPLQAKVGPDQVQAAVELVQTVEKARPVVRRSHSSRRSYLLLLALCLSLCAMAKAAPSLGREQLYALLQEANTAFQGANAAPTPEAAKPLYDQAILLYEKIIDQGGVRNAKLYYNLANAYLLKEDLGPGHSELSPGPTARQLGPQYPEEPHVRPQPAGGPDRDQRRKTRAPDAVLLALRLLAADEALPGLRLLRRAVRDC